MINHTISNRYLVDKYTSGTEWYRVYSDGWIEQGGRGTMKSSNTTINLLKPFSNTAYCVTTATWQHKTMSIVINSSSSITFDYPDDATGHFCWYACGY